MLKIPNEVEPEALVAMGDPDEKPVMSPRRLLVDYCFDDIWVGSLARILSLLKAF